LKQKLPFLDINRDFKRTEFAIERMEVLIKRNYFIRVDEKHAIELLHE